jgi:hypothetical protein
MKLKGTCGRGENDRDKYTVTNSWTYDQFRDTRTNKQHVTTRALQQLGMVASFQFTSPDFPFKISEGLVQDFKKEYKIKQRHIMKYITSKGNGTFEKTVKAAELFQKETVKLIPNLSPNCVINTNQTEYEYCLYIRQALSHKGKKTTEVLVLDIKLLILILCSKLLQPQANCCLECLSVSKKEAVHSIFLFVEK